jgi:hypothetical protein
MNKKLWFYEVGKYTQVGRLLRLDLGVDGQGEILKFRDLTYGTASSHRHAGLLFEIIQRSKFQFLYFCKQRFVAYF